MEPSTAPPARGTAGLHPQARDLLAFFAQAELPPVSELEPEQVRANAAALAQLVGPGPDVAMVQELRIPGAAREIGARRYRPAAAAPAGTIVYFHGGGWVIGGLDDADALCRKLALASGCEVINVDYRLAPEHRFPAAADDAFAALRWAAAEAAGRPLVVAGDSAGGTLAAVCALRARDAGGPEIALQVLAHPVTDHDFTTSSYVEHGDSGLLLGRAEMEWFWDHYVPEVADRDTPDASPLRADDLSGLPAAIVLVAEYDPLRDEGLAYAARLRESGVPVTLQHYEDMLHPFFPMVNVFERADEAAEAVGAAIRAAVAGGA